MIFGKRENGPAWRDIISCEKEKAMSEKTSVKRTNAAKKAWKTRRANAVSVRQACAAKKAWKTRRAKKASAKK
jgi:hypothetical protein